MIVRRVRARLRSGEGRTVVLVVGYVAAALAALAVVVWLSLPPDQRRELGAALAGQAATLVLGGVLVGAGLVWLLLRWPGEHPRRARRLAADVRLLARNPRHRLPVDGPVELSALAEAVNALAARLDDDGRGAPGSHAEADAERGRLAAVLADLPVPLLVVSPDGHVQLYNSAARALLGEAASIGRPVGALLDLAEVRDDAPAELLGTAPDGRPVRARVAPVHDPHGGAVTGYAVVLDADPDSGGVAPRRVHVGARPEFFDFAVTGTAPPDVADVPLRDLRCTVVDTETTGFRPGVDEVVSVGAVQVTGGRVRRQEVLQRLVDPRRPVPATSTAVHGISDADVRGQPVLEQVLADLARFAEGRVLVGHNVAFDLAFLRRRDTTGLTSAPVLDTLLLDAVLHPDHEDHHLDAVAERLGVEVADRHTALGDALVTAEVLVRLVPLLEEHGVTTLGEAVARSAAVVRAWARR